MINSNIRNTFQWNLERNSYIFIQENAFENFVCELATILSRPQCVNHCIASWGFRKFKKNYVAKMYGFSPQTRLLWLYMFAVWTMAINSKKKTTTINSFACCMVIIPDSKVHGANMGPTWVLSAPDGPMLAPRTLIAIRDMLKWWGATAFSRRFGFAPGIIQHLLCSAAHEYDNRHIIPGRIRWLSWSLEATRFGFWLFQSLRFKRW